MKQFDIGILGGGQLGRMILEEAKAWGLRSMVLDPSQEAPAMGLADAFLSASLDDPKALREMAESCQSLTIEIENVNTESLIQLEKEGHRILPSPRQLALLQDKGLQKRFLLEARLPTAPFVRLERAEEAAAHAHLFPAVAKLCRSGYDGRGVAIFSEASEACERGFRAPYYLEPQVSIQKELAVIVVRDEQKQMRHYEPVEMVFHEANLLDYLLFPADVPPSVALRATEIAKQVCEALDYVGVLAVELFWTQTNELLVNELAPRVHNSGHHTRESHYSSQFGQLLRILKAWPMGSTQSRSMAAVINILGPEGGIGAPRYEGLGEILSEKGCYVYLYGKKESRPYRKMGHISILAPDRSTLLHKVQLVKQRLGVGLVDSSP